MAKVSRKIKRPTVTGSVDLTDARDAARKSSRKVGYSVHVVKDDRGRTRRVVGVRVIKRSRKRSRSG